MHSPRKAILALLALMFAAIAAGCASKTREDTSIPWSRPASWEGRIPGMGDMEQQ